MNQPAGGVEYIELQNILDLPVPLFDPAYPTNTWTLSAAVDYVFPTGVVMDACGTLLVVPTNPAAFRSMYSIDVSIPIYGPWTGALNNAGESVKLRRPGAPELLGFVPRILTDKVNYQPHAPWPVQPDGGGPALERIALYAYGNDPVNWRASVPGGTPGGAGGARQHMTVAVDVALA
ncbi:MAG: hypothetical protein AAF492_13930, partial [Verrucomicrobiota bacterium]